MTSSAGMESAVSWPDAAALAQRMGRIVTAFIEALDVDQQRAALHPFAAAARRDWGYTPRRRPGLPLRGMDAAQQKATWELLEDVSDLDAVVVPTSGGGLFAGAILATRELSPAATVHGIQPSGADGLIRSLEIPQAEKDRLLAMTPASYIGKAAELAKRA